MQHTGKLDRARLWMMGEVSEFDESLPRRDTACVHIRAPVI
jgi:hypothetical protein